MTDSDEYIAGDETEDDGTTTDDDIVSDTDEEEAGQPSGSANYGVIVGLCIVAVICSWM